MKKLYVVLTFLALISLNNSFAQLTATSVANGNWTNPATWSCNCVPSPFLGYSTINVNHDVILNITYAHAGGTFTIASGASLVENDVDTFAVFSGTFINNGLLDVSGLGTYGTSTSNNNGEIIFKGYLNTATFNNNSGGTIYADSLTNTGTFNNYSGAVLYCDSILNTGTHLNEGLDSCIAITNTGTLTNNGDYKFTSFTNTGTFHNNELILGINMWNANGTLNNNDSINVTNYTNSGTHHNNSGSKTDHTNLWNTKTFNNYSTVRTFDLASTGGNFNNSSRIYVSNNFYSDGEFTNADGSFIDVAQNYYQGDTAVAPANDAYFTNNGIIFIANNFYNVDTIDGDGHICVGQNSYNEGVFLGTFNFCDNTGGTVDYNTGTITAGIITCDAGFTCFDETEACNAAVGLSATNASASGASDGSIVSTPTGLAPFSYNWSNSSSASSLSGLSTGTYSVTITDAANCSAVASAFVDQPSGVSNISESKTRLYPNPSNGFITIETDALYMNAKAEIFDMLGQKVAEEVLKSKTSELDLSILKGGIYFVRVSYPENKATETFRISIN